MCTIQVEQSCQSARLLRSFSYPWGKPTIFDCCQTEKEETLDAWHAQTTCLGLGGPERVAVSYSIFFTEYIQIQLQLQDFALLYFQLDS